MKQEKQAKNELSKRITSEKFAILKKIPKKQKVREKMKKTLLSAIVAIAFTTYCTAEPIQWTVESGGNGHYYEIIEVSWQSWDDSNEAAQQRQYQGLKGYMATITSQAENDFIRTLIQSIGVANHYYLGGYQPPGSPEPDGNWQWVTGEPWAYSNWNEGEPDMQYSEENALIIYSHLSHDAPWAWNDVRSWDTYASWGSYIVEYTPKPPCEVEMVFIPGGQFQMGDHFDEGNPDELPVHSVNLDSFYIGKYEVTNAQYCMFLNSTLGSGIYISDGVVCGCGNNQPYCDTSTSHSRSQIAYNGVFSVRTKGGRNMDNDPVLMVSWYGAAAYSNWLSQQRGKDICYNLSTWQCDFTKDGYRLPTEAEWEYAARGGEQSPYYRFPWGDTISHAQANYWSSYLYVYDISPTRGFHPDWDEGGYPYTSPIGSFSANGFGLFDMSGNVWEWCNDWYSNTYYSTTPYPHVNPIGPSSGTYRVHRGCSYAADTNHCRVSYRLYDYPYFRGNDGFRIASNAETAGPVAYWPFDGDANDVSGNGNHGTVNGAVLCEDRCGNPNSAYLFDGVDDCIEAPHSPSLDLTGPITLSAWIKSDGTYWVSSVITKMPDYEPAVGYTLCTIDSKAFGILSYSLDGSSHYSGWANSNTSVIDGEWHLLTTTYDGTEIKMYIDGQLESSETYSDDYQSNNSPLKIGYRYYPYYDGREGSHNWALNGAIDDVRIYNRALSQSEISELIEQCPKPDIEVSPLAHDFGDVELDTSRTVVVTISNVGEGELVVDNISFEVPDNNFVVTSGPNLPAVIGPNITEDIEITYTPQVLGYMCTILQIHSNDPNEEFVGVELCGVGISVSIPPSEQIQAILDFFDQAVEDGTIEGQGQCPFMANLRLKAFRHMLKAAGELIDGEYCELACFQLKRILWRCDGKPLPPDFIEGQTLPQLVEMIEQLRETLACE